jgi:DNA-binding CsgD family transcriptional regulator
MAGIDAAAARDRPGLPISSWATLISAIEESVWVDRPEQLRTWLRGHLAGVLPHRSFHCALGPVAGTRMRERFVASDGGLESYIARHRSPTGELATPAFRRWLDRSVPQTEADLDESEVARLQEAGFDRLLAFGILDRAGGLSTYCELGGVRAATAVEATYAAQILAPYVHAALVRVGGAAAAPSGATSGQTLLTPREREVLRWVSEGKTVWETARILGRSEHTIKNQVRRVYAKLGIHTRIQAARFADTLLHEDR